MKYAATDNTEVYHKVSGTYLRGETRWAPFSKCGNVFVRFDLHPSKAPLGDREAREISTEDIERRGLRECRLCTRATVYIDPPENSEKESVILGYAPKES